MFYTVFFKKMPSESDNVIWSKAIPMFFFRKAGIENVIASSGTSLTEGQIKQINKLTNNITVLYDGDSAGIEAVYV